MALFPVINPLGNGFVVNGFFANLDPSQRKTAIQKLTINFIMIGVGTLLIGHLFLLIFGLAIPVIQLGTDNDYVLLRDNIFTHPSMSESLNDLFNIK